MLNELKLEFLIAKRYTFTQYKEKFVSIINIFAMLGIALGVATLIIVMSVMNGYEKTLLDKILGLKGHLTIISSDLKLHNWGEIHNIIQTNVKEVAMVVPVIENQALAMTDEGTSGVIVKGMLQKDIEQKIALSNGVIDIDKNCKGLILGVSLEQNLHINYDENSQVKIVIPKFNETIVGTIPRMKSYNVCGTFDIGLYDYNNGIVFMNLQDAQLLFKLGESVTGIEITLKDLSNTLKVKNDIIQLLKDNNFGNANIGIIDWQQANKTLMDGLQVERVVMFLILSLIIFIAAFNIISSLILLVHDKMKEIAILRTIGMRKVSIMRIFIMSGCLVGIIGTTIGTVLGVLFSVNIDKVKGFLESVAGMKIFDPMIYFLTKLPSEIDDTQVIYIILISLFLSFCATIYPAWRVSKTSPATILRY
jgi:lipoprotein-releasing system permease protein